jgi:hypothetical protein
MTFVSGAITSNVRPRNPTDADFDSVVLLLPFNDADGSTTTTDYSNSAHTISFFGNAEIDASDARWKGPPEPLGGASLVGDGNGDYVTAPDSADWDFGTDDFTIELWVNLASVTGTEIFCMVSTYLNASTGLSLQWRNDSYVSSVWTIVNGWGDTQINAYATGTPEVDRWYHIAWAREGTTSRLFLDGALVDTDTNSTNITGGTTMHIGCLRAASPTFSVWGNMDDVRITKGVARYTAAFDAPTRPHPLRGPTVVEWPNVDTWSLDTAAISYPSSAPGAMDPVNMTWNDDGTRLYIWGDTGANSGPWYGDDALTTPYVPQTQTGATQVANFGSLRARGGVWNADGTALIIPNYGNATIRKYANSGTAYNPNSGGDLTTTHSETFTFTPGQPRSIDIHPDGTKMWVISNTTGRDIYEVNMSTAYDLTTASMGNEYEPAQADMLSMRFSPDGYKYYALALTTGVIHEYTVSTQWDISTSSYTSRSLDVSNSRSPIDFIISPDGTKMIILYFSTSLSEVGYYTI